MALTYDIKKCDQSACWKPDETMTSTCESLIWATMLVGINRITEENINEFAYRLEVDRRLNGVFSTLGDKPVTPELLRPFVGLSTNATVFTRLQFEKKTMKFFNDTFNKGITNA